MRTIGLNHIYRLIWSHIHNAWIAVAEIASSQGKSAIVVKTDTPTLYSVQDLTLKVYFKTSAKLALVLSCAFQMFHQQAYALDANVLPTAAQNIYGNSAISVNGSVMNVNQSTQQAIVHWQSFNIGSGATVNLYQPSGGSALYRVVGNDASQIYGQLNATGQLFLINPNGVLFGQGAQVNVGGLVASTLNMSNADFLNGRYVFNGGNSTASVSNYGTIQAGNEGYVVFLGNTVNNAGTIVATNGSVSLAAGQEAVLDFYGNGLVKTKLSGDALNAVINNSGNISAIGGSVQLATNARASAINVSGIIEANSLVELNGVIRLEGGDNARVGVSGTLSAQGLATGTKGGNISVTGEQVALFAGANLNASGQAGGGTVLVGGDLQGKNADVYNARTTYVDKNANIKVDATKQGNGGKAIVWSNDITRFYGNISAKGGAISGNGGFVEVSGKSNLDFIGKVDLSAINGVGGQFLLDPANIILNTSIQTNPNNNANGTADVAFGDAPFAGTTTIQISDITGFSEAFFQASNDITIASTLTMGVNNSIRLEANNNINVNAALTTSGTGSINLKADADNSGTGNLAIGGNITAREGGISLSAATITRTTGNIATTGATNGHAGNISITTSGIANLGAATITASGGGASAGNSGRNAGQININVGGLIGSGAIAATGSTGSGANTNGGNAGNVTITSNNGITAGAITTNGGNAGSTGNGNSGSAGVITVTNSTAGNASTGAINSRVGNAIGTGSGGTAGSFSLSNTASGNLTTGAITTAGQTNSNAHGGDIQLDTTSGNISTGALSSSAGTVRTGNAGKNAGVITVNSGGTFTTTTIAANGSAGLGTSQSGGNAGNISITANNGITTTTLAASGGNATAINGNGGNAGAINLTNNSSGNITTTTITARTGNATGTGLGGNASAINLTNNATSGNISTGNLTTQGGTLGHGGGISINGRNNVTLGTVTTSGGTTLTGNAGRNAGAVSVNAGGNIITNSIAAAGGAGLGTNQHGGSGGAVTLSAGSSNSITHNNITSAGGARTGAGIGGNGGNVVVSGHALLSANTTINSSVGTGGTNSGNVTFNGTINASGGSRSLTINSTAATTLNGAIGNTSALSAITTNAGGTTAINGGTVTTTGTQTYGDAVTTNGATTFTTTNSNINFNSTIVAGGNTNVSTGTGIVTATNASNNFTSLAITAGSADIRDAGAIDLGVTNVTGNYSLQSAGAITQSGAVNVGGTTTLNSGSGADITLNNTNNNFNSVTVTAGRDVNIRDANALTINASNVRSMNARALNGNLTLAGNIIATGGAPATAISLSASQHFINAGNFSLSTGVGKRWLVFSTNETTDTRGTLLSANYDFKQYNALVDGTILGSGDGFIYSIAPNISVSLTGTTSKTYDANASAAISGLMLASSGEINGDTVLLGGLSSATYDNKNMGVGKLVTSNNGINIASATDANGKQVFGYQLSNTAASGNVGKITPRNIIVSALSGQSKTLSNIDPILNYSVGGMGLVGGDTLVGALSRQAGEAVGFYNILQGSLNASSNYTIQFSGASFEIKSLPLSMGNQSPRELAGFNFNPSNINPISLVSIIEVGSTAAGNYVTGNVLNLADYISQEADKEDDKNKEIAYVLNFGLRLPSTSTVYIGEADDE